MILRRRRSSIRRDRASRTSRAQNGMVIRAACGARCIYGRWPASSIFAAPQPPAYAAAVSSTNRCAASRLGFEYVPSRVQRSCRDGVLPGGTAIDLSSGEVATSWRTTMCSLQPRCSRDGPKKRAPHPTMVYLLYAPKIVGSSILHQRDCRRRRRAGLKTSPRVNRERAAAPHRRPRHRKPRRPKAAKTSQRWDRETAIARATRPSRC